MFILIIFPSPMKIVAAAMYILMHKCIFFHSDILTQRSFTHTTYIN